MLEVCESDERTLSRLGFDTKRDAIKAFRSHSLSLVTVPYDVAIPATLYYGARRTVVVFPDPGDRVTCHVACSDGKWYEGSRVRGAGYDKLHMTRTPGGALIEVHP